MGLVRGGGTMDTTFAPNLRDLSTACPDRLVPSRLVRSAAPRWDAHVPPVVKEGMDLRGGAEKQHPLWKGFQHVHVQPMGDKERIGKALLKRMNRTELIRAAWHRITRDETAEKKLFADRINRGGLPLLNEMLLEAHPGEFRDAFRIVESALRRNRGLLFFCAAGKDRTGLLAMLLLSACEVREEDIVADYAKSNGPEARSVALEGFKTYEEKGELGLDVERFVQAPPHVMESTLHYLRKEYGGPKGYLLHAGVSTESMLQVQRMMGEPDPASASERDVFLGG